MNTFPGESASWEGVDAYFTWAGSPGMLVLFTLVAAAIITPKQIAAVTKVNRTSIPDDDAHVK